jgi:hypothetical protein
LKDGKLIVTAKKYDIWSDIKLQTLKFFIFYTKILIDCIQSLAGKLFKDNFTDLKNIIFHKLEQKINSMI